MQLRLLRSRFFPYTTLFRSTGTFMRGKVLIGDLEYESGPNNQRVSVHLSEQLEELGFDLVRFRTGTPPRIKSDSIDYSKTRSEEHTSELQSRGHLVCRLLLD